MKLVRLAPFLFLMLPRCGVKGDPIPYVTAYPDTEVGRVAPETTPPAPAPLPEPVKPATKPKRTGTRRSK